MAGRGDHSAAIAIGLRQLRLQPQHRAEGDRTPFVLGLDLDVLAAIDRLQVIERGLAEGLRAIDDAVDALGLGITGGERPTVRRILHGRWQPGGLVDILDHDRVGIFIAEHRERHLRGIAHDLAIGQQHGRNVTPIVAHDRDGIAEPEVPRARRGQDLVERVWHGNGRREAIIERVAAAVAAGREVHHGVEINLGDRQLRAVLVVDDAVEKRPSVVARRLGDKGGAIPDWQLAGAEDAKFERSLRRLRGLDPDRDGRDIRERVAASQERAQPRPDHGIAAVLAGQLGILAAEAQRPGATSTLTLSRTGDCEL